MSFATAVGMVQDYASARTDEECEGHFCREDRPQGQIFDERTA